MGNAKINDSAFKDVINNSQSNFEKIIESCDIEINNSIVIDITGKSFLFRNCNFKGARIDFCQNNSKLYETLDFTDTRETNKIHTTFLKFENCTFENDFLVRDCELRELVFSNVKITSKLFWITSSSINLISFHGNIDNYNFIESLVISEIEDNNTYFDFRFNNVNSFTISDAYISDSWINKNIIKRIDIDNTKFIKKFDFFENKLELKSFIKKCEFNDINTKKTDFGRGIEFTDSVFKSKALFESSLNLSKSELKFVNINFEKQVSFENSSLFFLKFVSVFFEEIVSFQNLKCEYIELDKTHFDKVGYFNDLTIKSPKKCSLSTLRTIKNQLNKTENKIDYLKFSVFEFNNLKSDKKTTKGDSALLWLNEYSNNFGTSWIRGICFTLIFSMFFFIILLIVNSYLDSDYPLCLNIYYEPEKFSFTLNYFLKFVFNLGFNDKEIQSNGWLYLIFIIAKIFISYGIYQTIQAFRKYGK